VQRGVFQGCRRLDLGAVRVGRGGEGGFQVVREGSWKRDGFYGLRWGFVGFYGTRWARFWGGVVRHTREGEVTIRYDHCDTCTRDVDSESMMSSSTRLSGAAKCRCFKLPMNDRPSPGYGLGPVRQAHGTWTSFPMTAEVTRNI
jgi:hypothetical protein